MKAKLIFDNIVMKQPSFSANYGGALFCLMREISTYTGSLVVGFRGIGMGGELGACCNCENRDRLYAKLRMTDASEVKSAVGKVPVAWNHRIEEWCINSEVHLGIPDPASTLTQCEYCISTQ